MYPKHSDVFSEYAKIALSQGLVSNAEDEEESPKPSKEEKKELSNAEIMYGVKNKPTKELLEEAHPKTVVMGPAYDRFNGVVENLQQRHNMMVDIALKNPRILQTNTRYVKAQEDLINETIKLGFYLDNLHQESLMRLADACTGSLTKMAAAPLAAAGLGSAGTIGVVAAIAGIAGLAVAQHYPQSQGIVADLEHLVQEIEEAVADYEELDQFSGGYVRNIQKAKEKIENLNSYLDGIESKYIKGENIVNKQAKKKYFQNLANQIISRGIDQKIETQAGSIIQLLDAIKGAGKNIKRIMLRAPQKYEEPTSDFLSTIQKGFHAVVPSDVKNVADRIEMLVESSQAYKNELRAQLENLRTMKESLNDEDLGEDDKPFSGADVEEPGEEDELAPAPVPSRVKTKTRPTASYESPDDELIAMLQSVQDEEDQADVPRRSSPKPGRPAKSYEDIVNNPYR
jgi:hypothetical protein